MSKIKDKIRHSEYSLKIQMLTLRPESWSIKYASDYFGVSDYSVRKALELKGQKGILALPEHRI